MMLVVLLIVAVLGQRILRAYGIVPGGQDDKRSAAPRSAVDSTYAPVDATAATPMPGNAVERARGVESTIQQQADDASKRIDAQSR